MFIDIFAYVLNKYLLRIFRKTNSVSLTKIHHLCSSEQNETRNSYVRKKKRGR